MFEAVAARGKDRPQHMPRSSTSQRLQTSHLIEHPSAVQVSSTCRVLGFRVVISGVISPPIWVKSLVTLLITLLITTHEPPSKQQTLYSLHPSQPFRCQGATGLDDRIGLGSLRFAWSPFNPSFGV